MRQVVAKRNYLFLHDDGAIHFPFSKFVTDRYSNPHTQELVAQSLRIFYRFCTAHQIDLAFRAIEGRCLTYNEGKNLADLCFRPLTEIEAMGHKKVVFITSAKAGKAPKDMPHAVEPNRLLDNGFQKASSYVEVLRMPRLRIHVPPGLDRKGVDLGPVWAVKLIAHDARVSPHFPNCAVEFDDLPSLHVP